MVRMKASNLTQIVNKLTDKARRVSRVDGASPEIHGVLLDEHRKLIASNPVGKNENLGPSITNPTHPNHVFSVDSDNRVTFGTSVEYAKYYNKAKGRDVVIVNPDIKSGITRTIIKYVGLK